MRCLKKVFGGALAVCALVSLASIVHAQTISCNNSGPKYDNSTHSCSEPSGCSFAPGDVVPCNLTVPQNATCTLNGVTVDGSIFVEQGGCLNVGGPEPTTVGGNVIANNQPACFSIGFKSTVAGNVTVDGATGDVPRANHDFVCNSTIYGSLDIESSATGAFWCIGANGSNYSRCSCGAGNMITGSVTFNNNAGGGAIYNNTIETNLNCSGNAAPFNEGNNIVKGTTSCTPNP